MDFWKQTKLYKKRIWIVLATFGIIYFSYISRYATWISTKRTWTSAAFSWYVQKWFFLYLTKHYTSTHAHTTYTHERTHFRIDTPNSSLRVNDKVLTLNYLCYHNIIKISLSISDSLHHFLSSRLYKKAENTSKRNYYNWSGVPAVLQNDIH